MKNIRLPISALDAALQHLERNITLHCSILIENIEGSDERALFPFLTPRALALSIPSICRSARISGSNWPFEAMLWPKKGFRGFWSEANATNAQAH